MRAEIDDGPVWSDIRAPAGGYTEPVIADDGWQWLYMGSDQAGMARRDETGLKSWQIANGKGFSSLTMGGTMSLVDVLPSSDEMGEVYALMGEASGTVLEPGLIGGLWYSADHGDSWEMLASSYSHTGYTTGLDENLTENDVGGERLQTNCVSASAPAGRSRAYGGGRHLQGNAAVPASGDTVFIANNDPDARGVSIWDGAEACPLPNAGTALPADPVGAILRLDVQENGTPILLVGYRGRLADGPGLFVCELPAAGVDCTPNSGTANCWPVEDSQSSEWLDGVDVRDLQYDHYADWVGETGIFVADGGNRPVDNDNDGLGETCTNEESRLSELFLVDDSSGNVSVDRYDMVTDSLQMLLAEATDFGITGVSMDSEGRAVVINMPANYGAQYAIDRAYRAFADDVYVGAAIWDPVNSGEYVEPLPFIYELDDYEAIRQFSDSDYGGAWLESSVGGVPAPFPARRSPGLAYDTYFATFTFANGSWTDYGVMSGGYNAWFVQGLAVPWTDGEESPIDNIKQAEGDVQFTFWPNIDADGLTYQSTVSEGVAIDAEGHIWAPARDVGLLHFASFEPFDGGDPEGAEVDCLFDGWASSANSVSVATDGSVWITLHDQSVNAADPYPHNIGVMRTEDQGVTWQYAAAGWSDADGTVVNVDAFDGERLCADNDATMDRVMPFDYTTGALLPQHAFSLGDTTNGEEVLVDKPSIGTTHEIRAVDRNLALLLSKPTTATDGTDTWTTDGGFFFTADAGGTWNKVAFDGDWDQGEEADCDERQSYQTAYFELVHPGTDNFWTYDPDDPEEPPAFRLDFVVSFAHGKEWVNGCGHQIERHSWFT